MTADQLPPAPHPTPRSRRMFLTLAALTAGAPLLAACRGGSGPGNDDGASSGTAPAAASPAPTEFQELEAHLMGHRLTVRVSPLVRAGEEATALVLELTRAADDAAMADVQSKPPSSDTLPISSYMQASAAPSSPKGASGTRLLDPGQGRVWTSTMTSWMIDVKLAPGQSETTYVPFGPVDVDQVTVFIPQTGLVAVRVIDRDAASGLGVDLDAMDKALDKLGADADKTAPAVVEHFTQALDESASTRTTDKDVTTTLASDVTFTPDSADLSDKADAQLQTVADQIAQHPDGGSLDIVGHTDDVADDAHNQKLSEDRAAAVKDRLGRLTDLASWKVTTTGKGESEPAVDGTTDEARAANRRVVITITPTGGTAAKQPGATGSAAPSSSNDGLPEAQGPAGKGPDGVTVNGPDSKGGQITITLDHATRSGGLLLGRLEITTGPGGTGGTWTLASWLDDNSGGVLSNVRGEPDGFTYAADGLTLLADGQRVYPADYVPASSKDHNHSILTERMLGEALAEGATTTVCVVWPDTGQDTLTLDHPKAEHAPAPAFRLTDIPVTDS